MKMSFDKIGVMQRFQKAAKRAVAASAVALQDRIANKLSQHASNIGAGGHPSPAGSPPGQNTGALMRSFQEKNGCVDATVDPNKPTYRVGTNIVYAKIQEFGGPIRAKKGKMLAIPIGVDGMRAAKQAKGNLRSLDLHFMIIHGKACLVKWAGARTGHGARHPVILFVLKKEVHLPARPYFRPSIEEHRAAMKEEFTVGGIRT